MQQENRALKESQVRAGVTGLKDQRTLIQEEEEEEEEEDIEEEYEEEETSPPHVPTGKRGPPCVSLSEERGKRQCTRPLTSHRHTHQPETVTCFTFR